MNRLKRRLCWNFRLKVMKDIFKLPTGECLGVELKKKEVWWIYWQTFYIKVEINVKKKTAHTKHVSRYRCKTLKGSLCFIYLYLTLRRNTRTFLADIINMYNFEVKIIKLMFQTLDDKFTRFFKALSKHNRKSKKCVFISPVNQMQDFIKNPEIFDINF